MSKDINECLIDRICGYKNSIFCLRSLMREKFKKQAFVKNLRNFNF